MRRVFSLLGLIVLACTVGCSNSDLPPMGRVNGVATLDGAPLPDAIVTLKPIAGGRPSQAVTDSNGAFEMSTFTVGDGALAGEHKIGVNPVTPPPVSYMLSRKPSRAYAPPFPDRYWSPESSGLTTTVEARQSNDLNLELTTN